MNSVGRKFLFGYLPYTCVAVVVVIAFLSFSHSWAAILAGGMLIVLWSILLLLLQLVLLTFRYGKWFQLKCAAWTFSSVFLMPMLPGLLSLSYTVLSRGTPDFEKDLAQESAACTLERLSREQRFGRDSYYAEAYLRCEPGAESVHKVWWYHYDKITGSWKRSQTVQAAQ